MLQVRPARDATATDDSLLSKLGTTQDGGSAVVHGAPPLPRPSALTLCFADPLLERKFRFYHYHKKLGPARVMIPLLLLLMVLLSVYDVYYTASDKQQLVRILRYGFQVPLTIIWYALTFSPLYFGVTQPLNTAFALAIGGLSIALSIAGEHPDHAPHMLFYFLVYMFLQLRVGWASFVCWSLWVGFIIACKLLLPDFSRLTISAGYMCIANLCLMIACYFVEYWLRIDFVRHHTLILEERKTNELLATLLPERITEQLRNYRPELDDDEDLAGSLIAEDHANVSILFSDIVGFTAYASKISAREVVGFLSNLYTCLDYLTTEHGVLKVETIGDAYFVASGVIEPRTDHATLLANFAFDMLRTLRKFKLKNNFTLRMRIGMHEGRVVAGVVGLKVPRFHLFGESVTIASLMEQTGAPGRIHVSEPMAQDLARWSDADTGLDLYTIEERVDPAAEAEELRSKRNNMQTYWITDQRENGSMTTLALEQAAVTRAKLLAIEAPAPPTLQPPVSPRRQSQPFAPSSRPSLMFAGATSPQRLSTVSDRSDEDAEQSQRQSIVPASPSQQPHPRSPSQAPRGGPHGDEDGIDELQINPALSMLSLGSDDSTPPPPPPPLDPSDGEPSASTDFPAAVTVDR